MKYTWTINAMSVMQTPDPNFVVQVSYTLQGEEQGYTSEIQNTAFFTQSEGDFVPYDQLTEELVLGWVKAELGDDQIANYEYCIADQIANQINPPATPEQKPLPWA